jgi:hypothetical protein
VDTLLTVPGLFARVDVWGDKIDPPASGLSRLEGGDSAGLAVALDGRWPLGTEVVLSVPVAVISLCSSGWWGALRHGYHSLVV